MGKMPGKGFKISCPARTLTTKNFFLSGKDLQINFFLPGKGIIRSSKDFVEMTLLNFAQLKLYCPARTLFKKLQFQTNKI